MNIPTCRNQDTKLRKLLNLEDLHSFDAETSKQGKVKSGIGKYYAYVANAKIA